MARVGKAVMRIHYAIVRIHATTSPCSTFPAGSRCSDVKQGVPAPDVGPAELSGYDCHAIGLFHHGALDRFFPRECSATVIYWQSRRRLVQIR